MPKTQPFYKHLWFWLVIIIVIFIAFIFFVINYPDSTSTPLPNSEESKAQVENNTETETPAETNSETNNTISSTEESTIQEDQSTRVSLSQYEQIEEGMTYEEVLSIFGGKEHRSSENELMGTKNEIKTWSGNKSFSVVTIVFKDGVVSSKSQTRLD